MAKYQTAKKNCRKFQPAEYGARTGGWHSFMQYKLNCINKHSIFQTNITATNYGAPVIVSNSIAEPVNVMGSQVI